MILGLYTHGFANKKINLQLNSLSDKLFLLKDIGLASS